MSTATSSVPANPVIFYSRSAVTADWSCPRKRFWQYESFNRGIVGEGLELPLFIGTVLHDALAAVAYELDLEEICGAAREQIIGQLSSSEPDAQYFAEEQLALVEGLIRGYHRAIWPAFKAQFPEVIAVEGSLLYEHDGLTFMAKPDLVVRDTDGQLWYLEYKSTSSTKPEWAASWSTAVQLHSSIKALERQLGEPVAGVIVQGLYKGYEQRGKQQSPFCYAYHRPAEPPFRKAIWSYEWKSGLTKYPTWEMPGGVKKWVADFPDDLLQQQFPQVPPIFVNEQLVQNFFKQRASREHEIRQARNSIMAAVDQGRIEDSEALLNQHFQQHFEHCRPGWGSGCAYRKICHGNAGADPFSAGYTLRDSHHAPEQELLQRASQDSQASPENPSL